VKQSDELLSFDSAAGLVGAGGERKAEDEDKQEGKTLHLESPFSDAIRRDCTAPDGYRKTNAAIPVEKQSDSVPPWTRLQSRSFLVDFPDTPFYSAVVHEKRGY
jgi:hypothetical protein